MNPRPILLFFLFIGLCCQVTLGQEPNGEQTSKDQDRISEGIKNLRTLQALIAKTLKNTDGPTEMDVRSSAAGARQIALGLQRDLGLSKVSVASEREPEPTSDSPRNTLRSLESLLTDLLNAPISASSVSPDAKGTSIVARQIEKLIEFTEPVQLEFRKDHPVAIWVLIDLFLTADTENTVDIVELKVVKLVRKRCVDFIDNGITFSALKAVGATDSLIKEMDTCLSAESRAIILNRVAATPADVQTAANATILGDVIRFLFRKKDLAGRKRFIEAGREFLRRFGDESCAAELADWLRFNIPKAQKRVDEMTTVK